MLLALGLVVLSVLLILKANKVAKGGSFDCATDAIPWVWAGIITGLIAAPVLMFSFEYFIMACFAPRMYVLHKIGDLIK